MSDQPDPPGRLARLGAALQTLSGYAATVTGVLALILLVVVTSWMIVDQFRFWARKDHTFLTAQRDFLCNSHTFDISEDEAANLSDMQKIVQEIYILKETARQHAVPFDAIGRTQHFIRCAVLEDVSATSVSFKMVQDQRVPYTQDIEALLQWEEESLAFVSDAFADMVPAPVLTTWGQRILALSEALKASAPSAPAAEPETKQALTVLTPEAEALQSGAVLITGSFSTPAGAAAEAERLARALEKTHLITEAKTGVLSGLTFAAPEAGGTVAILRTEGLLRPVAAFGSRAEADIAMRGLKASGDIPLNAYTRTVAAWCTEPVTPVADGPGDLPTFTCKP
ncbi:MAG: hypothetical protein AAGF60_00405 [Pseudomonadota bacterium]